MLNDVHLKLKILEKKSGRESSLYDFLHVLLKP